MSAEEPTPEELAEWEEASRRVDERRRFLLRRLGRDYGLVIGQPVELELMVRTYDGPTTLAGTLLDVIDVEPGGLTFVVGYSGGIRRVVPWHAIASILTRPAHPAL